MRWLTFCFMYILCVGPIAGLVLTLDDFKECAVSHTPCQLVHLNGTLDWHPRQSASYDHNRQQHQQQIFKRHRWCRDQLYSMLIGVDEAMRELNLTYYLVYGTLLGAVQSNAIHGWARDVDVAVPQPVFEQLLHAKAWYTGSSDSTTTRTSTIQGVFHRQGLHLFRGGDRLLRACAWRPGPSHSDRPRRLDTYLAGHVYVDVYLEYTPPPLSQPAVPSVTDSAVVMVNPSACRFPHKLINPTRRCLIRRRFFPCPREARTILRRHYGPGYALPRDQFTPAEWDAFGQQHC